MSEEEIKTLVKETLASSKAALEYLEEDPELRLSIVYYLWKNWGNFGLYITSPEIEEILPAIVVPPAPLEDGEGFENVYSIHDYGYKLVTSRAEDMFVSSSMYKLFNTIEKMMVMLQERLITGGFDDGTEIVLSFDGHEVPKRKAFEVLINFPKQFNLNVTDFDPGFWGEPFVHTVQQLVDKGYGKLEEAPRPERYRKADSKSRHKARRPQG